MRHLPDQRRLLLMQSLLTGDSVKKAASRVGAGHEVVTQFLLDAGSACREFHDRTVTNLTIDTLLCQRVWGFTYVCRRNAYAPEISRGVPREGWVWVARHPDTGMVVDWTVAPGDAPAAGAFIGSVRDRLVSPVALKAQGRDLVLQGVGPEAGGPETGERVLLARLFGQESAEEREEVEIGLMAAAGNFRRRCLNLELALSLHFTCHNVLADTTAQEPPAVRLGLLSRGWSLETLADLA